MFPVNLLSNNFTTVTYSVPQSVTNLYVVGLAPGAAYSVKLQTNGAQIQVTVAPGTQLPADHAGVLAFTPASLASPTTSPRWLSVNLVGGGLQLKGSGSPSLSYQVQMATDLSVQNWTTVGSVAADTNGSLVYTDPWGTNPGPRFFRLAR